MSIKKIYFLFKCRKYTAETQICRIIIQKKKILKDTMQIFLIGDTSETPDRKKIDAALLFGKV